MFYRLNDVQYMPNNPHNTIYPRSFKTLDGFTKVALDCGTDVILKHKKSNITLLSSKERHEMAKLHGLLTNLRHIIPSSHNNPFRNNTN